MSARCTETVKSSLGDQLARCAPEGDVSVVPEHRKEHRRPQNSHFSGLVDEQLRLNPLRVPQPRNAVDLSGTTQAALHCAVGQVHQHNADPLEPDHFSGVLVQGVLDGLLGGRHEGVATARDVAVAGDLETWTWLLAARKSMSARQWCGVADMGGDTHVHRGGGGGRGALRGGCVRYAPSTLTDSDASGHSGGSAIRRPCADRAPPSPLCPWPCSHPDSAA